MRVVLDTNVIVSGLITDTGVRAQGMDLWIAGEFHLVVDERILREYDAVLRRPELGVNSRDVDHVLRLARYAEQVVGVPLPLTFPDQGDLPFIEVAVAGGADAIVTGNVKHFLPKEGPLSIPVLSPRQFIGWIADGGRM